MASVLRDNCTVAQALTNLARGVKILLLPHVLNAFVDNFAFLLYNKYNSKF